MKRTKIIYWIFTGLFAALMLVASIPDIICGPDAVKFMAMLGYPKYLIPFLGVAKLLGIIVVVIPGFPRLKEWAYAGIAFDLIGATYSEIAVGLPLSNVAFMSIWFVMLIGSYVFYHRKIAGK